MSTARHSTSEPAKLSQRLLVFAKAPVLGKVKTRLQPALSPQQSLLLHRRLVEHTLKTVATLSPTITELWVSEDHPWWNQLADSYAVEIHRQQGNDLGERMAFALHQSLQTASKAIVIGSDCPFISFDYLCEAFDQLDQADVVMGPADDGGYVLVGLKRAHPLLFEGIDWGTDLVLSQTLRLASARGLNVVQLEPLRDIDRAEDVEFLLRLLPGLVEGIIV